MLVIIQKYVTDKTVSSPIKYSQKYLRVDLHTIPNSQDSTAGQYVFPSPLSSLPSTNRYQTTAAEDFLFSQEEKREMKACFQRGVKEGTAGEKEDDLDLTHFSSLYDITYSQTVTRNPLLKLIFMCT